MSKSKLRSATLWQTFGAGGRTIRGSLWKNTGFSLVERHGFGVDNGLNRLPQIWRGKLHEQFLSSTFCSRFLELTNFHHWWVFCNEVSRASRVSLLQFSSMAGGDGMHALVSDAVGGDFLVWRIEGSWNTIFQHVRGEKIEIVKVGSHLWKKRMLEGMLLCFWPTTLRLLCFN